MDNVYGWSWCLNKWDDDVNKDITIFDSELSAIKDANLFGFRKFKTFKVTRSSYYCYEKQKNGDFVCYETEQ